MSDFDLTLPFDTDDPSFRRGVEVGMLWQRVQDKSDWEALYRIAYGADDVLAEPRPVTATVHADCAEMVMRIAEAKGLPFTAEPLGEDWLQVVVGLPAGAA